MRILRMVVKELQQLKRDPLMIRLLLVAPLLQMLLLGYAATLDVRNIPTVFCDRDGSPESRRLSEAMISSGYFADRGRVGSAEEAAEALDSGRAAVAIVFPVRFGAELARPSGAPGLQALVDGTNSNLATNALGHLSGIVLRRGLEEAMRRLEPATAGRLAPPVEGEFRVWYNEDLRSSTYMVPGVIGLVLLVTTLVLTAMAVVKEKEIGTIEQIRVTPLQPVEYLAGKVVPFAAIGFAEVLVVLAVAALWFEVPVRGSIPLLLLLSLFFVLTNLGVGLFVSTISATQQQAMLSAFAFVTPNMLLSGFIFPIENMPAPIQALTYVMPMRYYLIIVRGILLKGVDLEVLWPQALALLVFGLFTFAVSVILFRRRLG